MTTEKLKSLFCADTNNCPEEFLQFDHIVNKRSQRRDIHAFLLLDEILPKSDRPIVADASHDEIYLNADFDELVQCITEEQALELIRCGVGYDGTNDSLYMFT